MPRNTVIKAEFKKKNVYAKSIDFRKKNLFTTWKSVALTIEIYGCGFQWNVARVFSTSSSSTRNLITALTCGDKLEVGG